MVNLNARESGITQLFKNFTISSLGHNAGDQFLEYYKIKPDASDAETLAAVINYITDISFFAPAVKLSQLWPGKYHVGLFNEKNPWDGIYKGRASHLLDTAYLWGNYNPKYTRENWAVGRAMAEDVISFISERDNLPVFDEKKKLVTLYGPSDKGRSSEVTNLDNEITDRDLRFFDLAKMVGGLDTLLDMMAAFLKV